MYLSATIMRHHLKFRARKKMSFMCNNQNLKTLRALQQKKLNPVLLKIHSKRKTKIRIEAARAHESKIFPKISVPLILNHEYLESSRSKKMRLSRSSRRSFKLRQTSNPTQIPSMMILQSKQCPPILLQLRHFWKQRLTLLMKKMETTITMINRICRLMMLILKLIISYSIKSMGPISLRNVNWEIRRTFIHQLRALKKAKARGLMVICKVLISD